MDVLVFPMLFRNHQLTSCTKTSEEYSSAIKDVYVVFWSRLFDSLPKDKILDRSKLKAFADNKISLNEKLKLVLGRVENIVGKGENAGNQPFNVFKSPLFQGC